MSNIDICTKIINALDLSPDDAKLIRKKRGFNDIIIERLKFRTCGPGAKKLPEDIPDEFKSCLSYKNIVIPYFNADNEIIHVRPHKFGITDQGAHPYFPFPLLVDHNVDFKHIVLAESEFKAVASLVMGVPAVGIPGISSFSKKKFNYLVDFLSGLKVEFITICFDNEIKDNPNFSNYKEDYTTRYDTEFYAFLMGRKLNKAGFKVKIAVLRDEWRVDGKIDIDGVLAAGIDYKLYQNCIANAVDVERYKHSWNFPKSHISFLERRIDKSFYEGPIHVWFNSYFIKKAKQNGEVKTIKISNFIIHIIRTLYTKGNAERYFKFISSYGDSDPIIMTADIMASRQKFIQFCYENGDYEFSGTEEDMRHIWHHMFIHQKGESVIKLTGYGYDATEKAWFFANGGYKDCKYYPVDENGLLQIGDKIFMLHKNDAEDFAEPKLQDKDSGLKLVDIYKNISMCMNGNTDNAKMIIGWALGSFFMNEILEKCGVYPFLFFYGKYGSGKSTLAGWISAFFGFQINGFPFQSSTAVGISEMAAIMSMIPIWLEEFRNENTPKYLEKIAYLRSVYDKSTIVKGTITANRVRTYKARSMVMLSGEEHPKDAALNSRCLLIPVFQPTGSQAGIEAFNWLEINKDRFSEMGHKILTKKSELWPKISSRIDEYLSKLETQDEKISARVVKQFSVVAGVCDVLMGTTTDFMSFVLRTAKATDIARQQEQALFIFYQDIEDMYFTGETDKFDFIELREDSSTGVKKTFVFFHFSAIYLKWEKNYKNMRADLPASKQSLISHIEQESYYVTKGKRRIGGKPVSALVFNYDDPLFPTHLKNIIEDHNKDTFNAVAKAPPLSYHSPDDFLTN